MMHHRHTSFFIGIIICALSTTISAKEVKDTLYSESGDRIILNYSITNSGGQMLVRFTGAQKKLGSQYQKKYKKLDEVAVVFFDRNGNYPDMKFDGLETSSFIVPANVTYVRSHDGYFLVSDNPTLQFKVESDEDTQINLPIYLASYEGKHHYKVFTQCGTLCLSSKKAKVSGKVIGGGRNDNVHAANAMNLQIGGEGGIITSEELVDEGLSPAEEALIRINSVKSMLEQVTEYPFDDELTHEVSMLRELRFKVTDEDVSEQINEALTLYDTKKKDLAGTAKANQQAQAEEAAKAAEAAQARNDSIAAAQVRQSEEDKKNMMWIGGGIGILALLFMGGKQIIQMVNQNKLQKQQKAMMENMMNISRQPTGSSTQLTGLGEIAEMTGLGEATATIPHMKEAAATINSTKTTTQQVQQQSRVMSREIEAARQKLMNLKASKQGEAIPAEQQVPTKSDSSTMKSQKRASLNDAIPAKYKRLAKRKE